MRFLRGSYVMLGLVVASLMFVACSSSDENNAQAKNSTTPAITTAISTTSQSAEVNAEVPHCPDPKMIDTTVAEQYLGITVEFTEYVGYLTDSGDYVAGPLEFKVSSGIYQHKGTTQPVDITAVLVDANDAHFRCKLELAVDIE